LKEFLNVKTSQAVFALYDNFFPVNTENITLSEGVGRVITDDIKAEKDIPEFNRSTVDGYALIAKDTYGASESNPLYLQLIDEVLMGQEPESPLTKGKIIKIATGGMLPPNADAVIMVEYTQAIDNQAIEIHRSVSPCHNKLPTSIAIAAHGLDYRAGTHHCSVPFLPKVADLVG